MGLTLYIIMILPLLLLSVRALIIRRNEPTLQFIAVENDESTLQQRKVNYKSDIVLSEMNFKGDCCYLEFFYFYGKVQKD